MELAFFIPEKTTQGQVKGTKKLIKSQPEARLQGC